VLEEQRKLHGAPLYPYLFYARNPAYFRAAQAMWTALQQDAKRVPVHSGRCSTVASPRGTAASFDRTPMLPWAATRYLAEKLDALYDTRRARSSVTRRRLALEYADASRTRHSDVGRRAVAHVQQHYDDDTIAELT